MENISTILRMTVLPSSTLRRFANRFVNPSVVELVNQGHVAIRLRQNVFVAGELLVPRARRKIDAALRALGASG